MVSFALSMADNKISTNIFSFLQTIDRKNLAHTCQIMSKNRDELEVKCLNILKEKVLSLQDQKEKCFLRLEAGNTESKLTIEKVLGRGGSKKAVLLSDGRVLLLPNMDVKTKVKSLHWWRKVIYEEVTMSNILTRIGLLTAQSQRVTVNIFQDDIKGNIPSYVSTAFTNIGKVIDHKNYTTSPWEAGTDTLFKSDEEGSKLKNWDSVLDLMLCDFIKIYKHNVPVNVDSLNLVVLKNPSESMISPYQIRYFGFDFSGLLISKINESEVLIEDDKKALRNINRNIENAVRTIVWFENYTRQDSVSWKDEEELIERCCIRAEELLKEQKFL